jgi:hypothetical protein
MADQGPPQVPQQPPHGPQQQPPPQPLVPQIPLVFLYSPWMGNIDLQTKAGKMLWDEGIRPLETKFTGSGRDLVRFLADVKNRVDKCQWTQILTINGKNLITQYGEISKVDVIRDRSIRNAMICLTLTDARPQINALMMFHFFYDSLGPAPQKQVCTCLDEALQDGPTLMKMVLDNTFVATTASTFSIKEGFYDLNLKKYRWNVHSLNQDVREKLVDLVAAGHASDPTDVIITLFRAYNTSTNEEFKASTSYWKNEWTSKLWSQPEELMTKADAKYNELKDLGTWGKRSVKDDQIIALTTQMEALTASMNDSTPNKGNQDNKKERESSVPKWKYDKTLSSTDAYDRNDKTYKWCTGPGHNAKPMWVVDEPGTCTKNKAPSGAALASPITIDAPSPLSRAALTVALTSTDDQLSADEVESKVEAILAVMES